MTGKTGKQSSQDDEHNVPGPVNPEIINKELGIMRYVEKETHNEKVKFLEKVKTEQVFDTRMDIWNVRTDKNQYWVITNPSSLYSQTLFPSYDYALTFHVGLAFRNASNHHHDAVEKEQDQLAVPWRHWELAVVSLDKAEEMEEFQAVGILCRQCLLSIVKSVISNEMVSIDQDHPHMVDFLDGSKTIVNSIAPGSNAEALRSYLITISKAAWEYVNWLTHATNATKSDGRLAIGATEYVLMAFGAALHRHDGTINP